MKDTIVEALWSYAALAYLNHLLLLFLSFLPRICCDTTQAAFGPCFTHNTSWWKQWVPFQFGLRISGFIVNYIKEHELHCSPQR